MCGDTPYYWQVFSLKDDMRVALVLKKLQLIYVPFILLCLIFVSGYSLLHWLLIIEFQLLSIDESIINFWLPLILPWPLLFFYLRPRLKLFRFTKSNSRFIYFVIAVLLLAVPTIVAQEYLNSATGKLTQLESINALLHQPQTKYYQLNQFYIDKKHIGVQRNIEPIGKGNSELRMSLYIAMPIFAKRNESWLVGAKALAWYGKVYEKTISNRLEPQHKEALFQEFIHQSQQDFNAFKPEDFVYLDRIGPSTRYTQLLTAAQKSSVYFDGYQTVLMPVNKPFEARNGHKLAWIIAWLSFAAILWLLMSLMLKLDETQASKALVAQLSIEKPKAELYGFLAEFKPRQGFVITPILLYINALIFMLMAFASQHVIAFPNSLLLDWGANLRQLVLEQQVWRLISNVFLHVGLMHLVFNLYGLFFAGMFSEPLLGKWRLLGVYLCCGLVASIASISWYEAMISIGASGAIMGLFGVLIMWIWLGLLPLADNMPLALNLTLFVTVSLVMGLFGGVDNAAHLGGLGCGLLLGSLLRPTRKAAIQHK